MCPLNAIGCLVGVYCCCDGAYVAVGGSGAIDETLLAALPQLRAEPVPNGTIAATPTTLMVLNTTQI